MQQIVKDENKASISINAFVGLFRYFKKYQMLFVGVVISLIITSSAVLLISSAIKFFIDFGMSKRDLETMDNSLEMLAILIIVLAIFTFCRFVLITIIGERIITDLRRDIYKHILRLSPKYYANHHTGDIISRLTADTTILLQIISSSASVALRNMVMLAGGIIMMINISPKLSGILFLLIPIIIAPIILLGKKLRLYSKNSQDRIAELTIQSEETLNSLITIQAYLQENRELHKYNHLLMAQLRAAYDRITLRGVLTAVIISLVFGGISFALWIGGHQVIKGAMSAGELSAFVYIAIICAGAVAALTDVVGDLQKAAGASERIFEFLKTHPDVIESHSPIRLHADVKGHLRFQNIVFSYEKDAAHKVFDNLSLDFAVGKITALVGKSGVGKTSIFMLLQRFYDVDSGSITIDDINIKDVSLEDLRKQFTYVTQEPIIFSATVRENIAYSKPDASMEEIEAAAIAANCKEFIDRLPNKYDSHLGEKGVKLSGGQKQRISIARAILNNPKILLLDEATSSLDSENETEIQAALLNLMKDRTTIVIAHRLSTVKNADVIMYLEDGKVIERGTHDELLQLQGKYSDLLRLQLL